MTVRETIAAGHPGFPVDSLDAAAWRRIGRLAEASPLYAHELASRPELCLAIEAGTATPPPDRRGADGPSVQDYLSGLRRWRRATSMRIAHRSVNALADEASTVAAISSLAEYCLRECLRLSMARWTARMGEPWDSENGRPARFCVLGLGKLGGAELNFSSDVDLIYCYEGDSAEFFVKVAETLTQEMAARTGDGFLFRVDVRLRPEGAWGPLVHSLSAIENYYSTAGQTWERMALIKARPVAGDLALGAELLEDLHAFRYPRRPPLSLLSEVAAMKLRTESEVVGVGAIERDVKRGRGGIREIEFISQSLQLLNAGRYPFLQTHSTAAALDLLARYELLPRADAGFLAEAYWFLRRVEHRLQMREEGQIHELPEDESEVASLAASLGFAKASDFLSALNSRRRRVHELYSGLFSDRGVDRDREVWWEFFTTDKVPPMVAGRLSAWCGDTPGAAEALRHFACGDRSRMPVTEDLVTRFRHLASHFDPLMPVLARPLDTLARLARFAERYGTRQQFLGACAENPQLLRVLALICDRSTYASELLCAHPEILEEVLRPEMLRRRKTAKDLDSEIAGGDPSDPNWLWLYVRAEQMRHCIGELLGFLPQGDVETALTLLADAVLRKTAGNGGFLVVALGKYGGGELTFGSDLDLLFIDDEAGGGEAAMENLRRSLRHGGPLGPVFSVDLRLRPHGDAGPLATTIEALADYHRGPAQTWEKQLFTRARVVCGPPALADRFNEWIDAFLYAAPLSAAEEQSIWAMRARIERERDAVAPAERAIKTGPGALMDCEFLAQVLQLREGTARPAARRAGTRAVLELMAPALLENFDFLKKVEFALRRDTFTAASVLPEAPSDRHSLARWLGFADEAGFWTEHTRRMRDTRRRVLAGSTCAKSALGP